MAVNDYLPDTNKRVQITVDQPDAYQLTWSPDSKSVYFTTITQTAGEGDSIKLPWETGN